MATFNGRLQALCARSFPLTLSARGRLSGCTYTPNSVALGGFKSFSSANTHSQQSSGKNHFNSGFPAFSANAGIVCLAASFASGVYFLDGISYAKELCSSVQAMRMSSSAQCEAPASLHASEKNASLLGNHETKKDLLNETEEGEEVGFPPLWRSKLKQPIERNKESALIFCGNANESLGKEVADHLGTRVGKVLVKRFSDGEVSMQFLDSMRGKDVYIIQPTSPPVNDHLMELLLMISTCRRSSAKKITAVIPYYGYARQDRKLSSRVPISAADVACMLEAVGVDRVVAVDLHSGQIQGFFGPRIPVDNLEAQIVGLEYFSKSPLQKPMVVSPDAGGVYRARKFQEGLIARGYEDCGIAMLIKHRMKANEIDRMDLVGNVDGSDVIIVDDMIDTAGTLCEAARELRKKGARRVMAFATHGLFSGRAIQRITDSCLEEVVVTDSIKLNEAAKACPKIVTLSISVLVADAIRRIHQKESLNDLFNFSL